MDKRITHKAEAFKKAYPKKPRNWMIFLKSLSEKEQDIVMDKVNKNLFG